MFRRVPFTDEPVVFSPTRAARKGGASCPFCPGNESQTCDEVAGYRKGGKPGDSNWRVRASDAAAFVDAFAAVQPRLGEAYNVLFYAPVRAGRNPALHWHVSLAPRNKRPAGFELSTGVWVVDDEDSAPRLVM